VTGARFVVTGPSASFKVMVPPMLYLVGPSEAAVKDGTNVYFEVTSSPTLTECAPSSADIPDSNVFVMPKNAGIDHIAGLVGDDEINRNAVNLFIWINHERADKGRPTHNDSLIDLELYGGRIRPVTAFSCSISSCVLRLKNTYC